MNIINKLFKKKAVTQRKEPQRLNSGPKIISSPQEIESSKFVRLDDGNLMFNVYLFTKKLGRRSPSETEEATKVLYEAIDEIGSGTDVSDYDLLYLASFELYEALVIQGLGAYSYERLAIAGSLYDKYSPKCQSAFDEIISEEPRSALLAEVYKKLGPGHPSEEQIRSAQSVIIKATKEIEQKGIFAREGDDEILVYNNLTHHFITHCYWHMVSTLSRFGEGQQALNIVKIMCQYEFYSQLSESARQIFQKEFEECFPRQFIAFKAFALDKHEEKIRQSKQKIRREEKEMNINLDDINTAKKIYDRWRLVTRNLPIDTQQHLEQHSRGLINLVHSATFSLEIGRKFTLEKATGNMMEMMKVIELLVIVSFSAGLERQYHESKGHSVKDGQISFDQFMDLTMQVFEPIAHHMNGLMNIYLQDKKLFKIFTSKTGIATEHQYLVASTDAVTDLTEKCFELDFRQRLTKR